MQSPTSSASDEALEPTSYLHEGGEQNTAKYGLGLLGAIVIILAVAAFFVWQTSQRYNLEVAAQKLYGHGEEPAKWAEVIQRYPKTAVAAQALIRMASQASKEQKYEQAARFYQQFLEQFPHHPVYPACQLGAATALEANRDFAHARTAYEAMTQKTPQPHAFAVPAMLGLARIDVAEAHVAHAQQLLQQIMSDYPHSSFQPSAKQMLVELESKK